MRLTQWIDEFRDDLTFAIRQLRRSPAFALIATDTLALGIGANSAIFALVDATLLRPLPFRDPDRLVMVWERIDSSPRGRVAPLNLLDWNDRSRTFDDVRRVRARVGGMVMDGADGTAETVPRQWVTAGFFDVLGVKPIVGRTFLPSDDAQRANVVVLSEAFWRTRFNGDPSIVGRDIRLDGDAVHRRRRRAGRFSAARPEQHVGGASARSRPRRSAPPTSCRSIGRMKPGVTIDAARADLTAVAEGLAREFPQTNSERGVALEPLHEALIGSELRLTSMLFLGVVGFVLLICCANVANLLLARATARTRELAMRAALGASRRRVVRQLVTESLMLSIAGGVAGSSRRRGDSARGAHGDSARVVARRRAADLRPARRRVLRCARRWSSACCSASRLPGSATGLSSAQVLAVGQPDDDRRRREAARCARGRGSRHVGAAALWCGAAVAHARRRG